MNLRPLQYIRTIGGKSPLPSPLPAGITVVAFILAGAFWVRAEAENHRLKLAREWTEQGRYDKALRECRLLLMENPDEPEVYREMGDIRMRQGRQELAAESYRRALNLKPDWKEVEMLLARAQNSAAGAEPDTGAGKQDTADRAEPGGPSLAIPDTIEGKEAGIYADPHFLEAIDHYRSKRHDKALEAIRRTLDRHAGHPGAYYLAGVIRFDRSQYDMAVRNFRKGLTYPEKGYNAHYYLGRIHEEKGRLAAAIREFRAYLGETRSDEGRRQVKARLERLEAELARERRDGGGKSRPEKTTESAASPSGSDAVQASGGAIPERRKGAESRDKSLESRRRVEILPIKGPEGEHRLFIDDAGASGASGIREAARSFNLGLYDSAIRSLKRVVLEFGGSGNSEAATLNQGTVYLALGLLDNARAQVEDYLASHPASEGRFLSHAEYLSALISLEEKEWVPAEGILNRLEPNLPFGPSAEAVGLALARVGELSGDPEKGRKYLLQADAVVKDPLKRAEFRRRIGLQYQKEGRIGEAKKHFDRAREICRVAGLEQDSSALRSCAVSQLRLADLEYHAGNWKAALAAYGRIAKGYPDFDEADWVHYQMANAYKSLRRYDSALNQYDHVIDNYPYSYWAAQAKWRREDTIWRREYEEVID